jgi:hypothetical protein
MQGVFFNFILYIPAGLLALALREPTQENPSYSPNNLDTSSRLPKRPGVVIPAKAIINAASSSMNSQSVEASPGGSAPSVLNQQISHAQDLTKPLSFENPTSLTQVPSLDKPMLPTSLEQIPTLDNPVLLEATEGLVPQEYPAGRYVVPPSTDDGGLADLINAHSGNFQDTAFCESRSFGVYADPASNGRCFYFCLGFQALGFRGCCAWNACYSPPMFLLPLGYCGSCQSPPPAPPPYGPALHALLCNFYPPWPGGLRVTNQGT